jgi:hypothetical protein
MILQFYGKNISCEDFEVGHPKNWRTYNKYDLDFRLNWTKLRILDFYDQTVTFLSNQII